MERFTLEHLVGLKVPAARTPFDLSSDGRFLALTMVSVGSNPSLLRSGNPTGVPQEVMRPSIVVVDTEDGSYVNPFGDTNLSWGSQWSPDGRYLAAYIQKNESPACLAIWDRSTSETNVHINLKYSGEFGFEVPRWTEDGRRILMKMDPGKSDDIAGESDDKGIRRRTFGASGVLPVEEIEKRANLVSVDVDSGEVSLLAEDWLFRCWRPSPDGRHVACLRLVEHDDVSGRNMCDLMVIGVGDGKTVCVAEGIGQSYTTAFSWSPDGTRLCYLTWGGENSGHPFVVAKDGAGSPIDLTGDRDVYVRKVDSLYELPPRWSPDSDAVFLLVPDGIWVFGASGEDQRKVSVPENNTVSTWLLPQKTTVVSTAKVSLAMTRKDDTLFVAELDLESGDFQEKLKIDGSIQPCTLLNDASSDGNTFFVARESATKPPEVIKVSADGPIKRIYKPLSSIDSIEFGTPELVEFENNGGENFKAALMLPPGFDGSLPVPAITVVYGDYSYSEDINRFGFSWTVSEDNAHFLAHRGYAVIYPDIELSGRDPMNQIVDRTTPVIEHLIDRKIIDPDRIGLYGHSYGAYSVLALITGSNFFRAAVCNAPIVNLSSFYGRGNWFWFETGQGRLGKPPWGDPEAYVRNSPLFFLDKVQASVLLLNGSEDIASAGQAAEAYSGLLRLGRKVEWIQYEGADHFTPEWECTKFEHLCNAILDWFDQNL